MSVAGEKRPFKAILESPGFTNFPHCCDPQLNPKKKLRAPDGADYDCDCGACQAPACSTAGEGALGCLVATVKKLRKSFPQGLPTWADDRALINVLRLLNAFKSVYPEDVKKKVADVMTKVSMIDEIQEYLRADPTVKDAVLSARKHILKLHNGRGAIKIRGKSTQDVLNMLWDLPNKNKGGKRTLSHFEMKDEMLMRSFVCFMHFHLKPYLGFEPKSRKGHCSSFLPFPWNKLAESFDDSSSDEESDESNSDEDGGCGEADDENRDSELLKKNNTMKGDGAGHNRSAEEAAVDNTETDNTVDVAATAEEEKQVAAGSLGDADGALGDADGALGVAAGSLGVAAGALGVASGALGDPDEDMKDPQIASSSGDDKDDTGTKDKKIVKREMVIECIAPYEKYKWKNIGAMKDGARSDNIQYATAFSPPYHLQSILRMQGHSKKGSSKTTNNTMIFIVLQGAVTVTLNGKQFTAKKGDSFFFPAQSTYDLINEWDETVEMSLLQFHYHQEMRCVPVDPDSTLA